MSDETAVQDPPADPAPAAPAAPAEAQAQAGGAAGDAEPKRAPKPAAAKKAKAKKPSGKDKKEKSAGKKSAADPSKASVASHPKASAQIRLAKGWGGLGGFAIAAYLSLRAAVPPELAAMRAIVAGAAGYMLAWGCAVMVWRHLVAAELRAIAEQRRRRAQEQELALAASKKPKGAA